MQYSLPGENKDGGIYTRASTRRDRDRDNIAIFSSGRGQGWRNLLGNLPEDRVRDKNAIFSTWRGQRWRYLH
jgi:hypothetical protein